MDPWKSQNYKDDSGSPLKTQIDTDTSIDDNCKDDFASTLKRQKIRDSPETQAIACSQVPPEESVTYDYIFKKILTRKDAKVQMEVPRRDAEKHFPHILHSIFVSVYDTNREQKRNWKLSRNDQMYKFTTNWKVYVKDNQLEEGDSVIFYIKRGDQIVNSELPHYAVKIKRAYESTAISPVPLLISLDKKALQGPRAMIDMVD